MVAVTLTEKLWLPPTASALVVPLPRLLPLASVIVQLVPEDIAPLPLLVTVKVTTPSLHEPLADRLDLPHVAVMVTVGVWEDVGVLLAAVVDVGVDVLVDVLDGIVDVDVGVDVLVLLLPQPLTEALAEPLPGWPLLWLTVMLDEPGYVTVVDAPEFSWTLPVCVPFDPVMV